MSDTEPKLAALDDAAVAKVRALEQALGPNVVVLAYDRPLEVARLTPEQIDQVMEVERQIPNAYLVVYLKPKEPSA